MLGLARAATRAPARVRRCFFFAEHETTRGLAYTMPKVLAAGLAGTLGTAMLLPRKR